MMAFDPGRTPPNRLDAATVTAVRDALRLYLTDTSDSATLRRTLRRISTEARDKDVYAEQLLVVLKDTWHSLPSVRAMTDTTEQALLLEHVVTMCIEEYYG
jgi:hypothetical protein